MSDIMHIHAHFSRQVSIRLGLLQSFDIGVQQILCTAMAGNFGILFFPESAAIDDFAASPKQHAVRLEGRNCFYSAQSHQ